MNDNTHSILNNATAADPGASPSLSATFVCDAHGAMLHWTASAQWLLGYDDAAVRQLSLRDIVSNADALLQVEDAANCVTTSATARRADGSTFPVELHAFPEADGAWRIFACDVTCRKERDIELSQLRTALRQDEVDKARYTATLEAQAEALKQANEDLQRLVSASPYAILSVDPDLRVRLWNSAAERCFNCREEDALGEPLESVLDPSAREPILKGVWRAAAEQRLVQLDDVHVGGDATGGGRLLSVTIAPVRNDSDGPPTGPACMMLAVDITDRRKLEARLAHVQKLESIGELAAGVAHEINTPIQYVGDNVRFLQEAFESLAPSLQELAASTPASDAVALHRSIQEHLAAADLPFLLEECPKAIEQALEGVERVATIVRAMKDFSHPGVEEMTMVDLRNAITSTVTIARNEWKYVADVELDLDPALPLTPCLPGEFNQALLNIVVNAAQAIAERQNSDSSGKGLIRITAKPSGSMVEIRVKDTGGGIPQAIRDRVFDLFFTTKDVGKGTGQGLAIAHSCIVERHKGELYFEVEEGVGTTFVIRLPLCQDSQSQQPTMEQAA